MAIQDHYDLIVVGCGFCGSVIARLAAEECGKRVLVFEKRNHIAGNMYDEMDKDGFLVQKYGPHIFHTNEDWIFHFVNRFTEWFPYQTFYGVELDGKCVPAPFGFKAIQMLYEKDEAAQLIRRLQEYYPDRESVPVLDLMECTNKHISALAEMLYEKDYRPYAAKQWNLDPKQLDRSVMARMPIILSERENYFNEKYEILPERGYTEFFKNMLSYEGIDVLLETDACQFFRFDLEDGIYSKDGEKIMIPLVFTGALEDIFSSSQLLPYRSLYFEYETMEVDSYQPVSILTYPQRHAYLRTTEYSKFMKTAPKGRTLVAFEYPVPYDKNACRGNEPYYPVLVEENIEQNNTYLQRLKRIQNIFPCGRLADYKYYNMDQAVIRAFEVFEEIKSQF